ncbi:MAG TPA: cupin domain-containing protein [Chloroflexota bacterium]|nr:cupin domain-containing protein [Chloroflexota bacterium]
MTQAHDQTPRQSGYQQWIAREGIPIVRGHGIRDIMAVELAPWPRMGGRGAYVDLMGQEGITGFYVAEIPPGGALEPERHLYDETIYVLSGRGSAKVWAGTRDAPIGSPSVFEWQAGSMFSPPVNTWHQLFNVSGTEPIRLVAATIAPLVMDIFHNPDFVFNCDYQFTDRYQGQPDFYEVKERFYFQPGRKWLWETNLVPDVRGIALIDDDRKAAGGRGTHYQMGGNVLAGHMYEFPAGCYHKAHAHGGGAIILNVSDCKGYTLLWPPEAGVQPYASGHGDRVVRVDWGDNSLFSPAGGWFHQHFNTGRTVARQLAFRLGSHRHDVVFHTAASREGQQVSVKDGGTLIEYGDEDPRIRADFQRELAEFGVAYEMDRVAAGR